MEAITENEPLLVSVKETERKMNLGHTKVCALIKSKDLKSLKVGSRRLVVNSSIHDLVARLSDEAA